MAVVGQQLTAPEAGWKRIDDSYTGIIYTGGWSKSTNYGSSKWQGGDQYTTNNGASISFKFYGTKLRVIASSDPGHSPNMNISIDGVDYSFSQYNSTAIFQALQFEKLNLDEKFHTVILTKLSGNYGVIDAFDIDETGELMYSTGKEVTNLADMQIGDLISCEYTASSGNFGTFGNLGSATKDLIPIASSATPDGKFYFIHTGYDHLGRMKLVADRNIQHSISWDKLNEVGIVGTENIISIDNKDFYMRLLSGGVSASDKDNEWDKIIAEYDLDETTIAGNNSIWNWSGLGSWTSSTPTTGNTYRAVRGNSSVIARIDNQASSVVSATIGFRPVLLVTPSIYLSIVSFTNATYNQNIEIVGSVEFIDEEVSNIKYRYVVNGVAQSWSAFGSYTTFNIRVPYNLLDYGVNEITVDVETVEGETSYVSINVTRVITELLQPQAVYSNKVTLDWLPIMNGSKYNLQRSIDSAFTSPTNIQVSESSHQDDTISALTEYWYRILMSEGGVKQVACGYSFTVFLMDDGTVRTVGHNQFGQLGNGVATPSPYYITTLQTPNVSNVKQVACGDYHTVFVLNDGTVRTVGNNQYGQLGTGSATPSPYYLTSLQTPNISNVKQVACGYSHTVFLLNDGTVRTVGYNDFGQCGTGNTTTPQLSLYNPTSLTTVKQVACGYSHTVFLLEDGTVRTVGYNASGQCATGNTTTPQLSLYTPNISNVKQVACGDYHTVFVLNDGTVRTVGYNDFGQCATGNTTTSQLSLYTPNISNVKQVACGDYYTVFLLEDGTVRTVGYNGFGQCGTGNTTTPQLSLYNPTSLTTVKQVACGYSHTVFLLEDGTVRTVGYNASGQCATGNTTTPQLSLYSLEILLYSYSNVINITTPPNVYSVYIWVDEEYLLKLIEGLGFDSILTDYDFYTTPDGIKLKPLALGGLVGGTTSNIFAFEVINTYTNKNYSVMLKASKNGIFASDEGLLQDAVRDQDKTKIEFSESAIFEPVYPIIFTVNAGEKKIIYLRLKTTTITNGETTFQINMTGREI